MNLDDNVLENILNNPESPREHALAKALLACHATVRRLEEKVDGMERYLVRLGVLPASKNGVMLNYFLSRDPEVCGGEPVIAGTRITVRLIWMLHSMGKPYCDIIKDYPQLSLAQVDAAVEYAKAHPELQKEEEEDA